MEGVQTIATHKRTQLPFWLSFFFFSRDSTKARPAVWKTSRSPAWMGGGRRSSWAMKQVFHAHTITNTLTHALTRTQARRSKRCRGLARKKHAHAHAHRTRDTSTHSQACTRKKRHNTQRHKHKHDDAPEFCDAEHSMAANAPISFLICSTCCVSFVPGHLASQPSAPQDKTRKKMTGRR